MSPKTQIYSSKQAEILRKHLYGESSRQSSALSHQTKTTSGESHSKAVVESDLVKNDLFKTLLLSSVAISIQVILYFGIQIGWFKI